MRGRVCGSISFVSFLVFHVYYLSSGWHSFDLPAKINSILITVTVIMFLSAYFLRTRPVSFSAGFVETVFPLFCASLPLVIYHNIRLLAFLSHEEKYYHIVYPLLGLHEHEFLGWNIVSMILVISGNIITLTGIVFLKRSFSIMVEARQPVYSGIYSFVRHPLYVGETVATAGVLVFRPSNINAALFVIFIICQVIRARLEERKIEASFPEYAVYRQKTGAVFPKFRAQP